MLKRIWNNLLCKILGHRGKHDDIGGLIWKNKSLSYLTQKEYRFWATRNLPLGMAIIHSPEEWNETEDKCKRCKVLFRKE